MVYKGLMICFNAMTFINGDGGIDYKYVKALTFEEKTTYPGILISYEAGIGDLVFNFVNLLVTRSTNR